LRHLLEFDPIRHAPPTWRGYFCAGWMANLLFHLDRSVADDDLQLSVTPDEQAREARSIAAFVERMLAISDGDSPGAWEETMCNRDAQRPHSKLFEDLSQTWRG
jgi:hypothetical protein